MITTLDRFKGCLLGGAVGDALGAPVEFLSIGQIRQQFGANGIQDYAPAYGRLGAITDDTQMTIWTAEGLIRAFLKGRAFGVRHPSETIWEAYLRWLKTQGQEPLDSKHRIRLMGWLFDVNDLHSRRAPGNTCLSALSLGFPGDVNFRINESKGCGGVMRVAPIGLAGREQFELGCAVAALTHGHPTGFLAAGVLAEIIHWISDGQTLETAVERAIDVLKTIPEHKECLDAIQKAIDAFEHQPATSEALTGLGLGWIAEEALAMSIFCALQAEDFASGIRLAVNHSGDSDSTGAITGNILGALWGIDAIPQSLLTELELRDVIEQIAQDLYTVYEQDDVTELSTLFRKYPPI